MLDSPEGSRNTFKARKNISLYFKRGHLMMYEYQAHPETFDLKISDGRLGMYMSD